MYLHYDLKTSRSICGENSPRGERVCRRLWKDMPSEKRRLLLAILNEKDMQVGNAAQNSYTAGMRDGISLMIDLFYPSQEEQQHLNE